MIYKKITLSETVHIDAAKRLIRVGELNFTQISEQLGYSSIYYFSRQF